MKKSVLLPPYAIADLLAAMDAYTAYINNSAAEPEFFNQVLNNPLLQKTYITAIAISYDQNTLSPPSSSLENFC